MFVEKQIVKILSSVGAICKNGLNTVFLYVAPTELMVFAYFMLQTFHPCGVKNLIFQGLYTKNLPLSALEKGTHLNIPPLEKGDKGGFLNVSPHQSRKKFPIALQMILLLRVFQLATILDERRFFAALRMTFYVTLNEVKGLLCAIGEKLVLSFIISFVLPIILALFLSACNEQKTPTKPIATINVQPINSVYIQYSENENIFHIGNGLIERTIFIDKKSNHTFTTSFTNRLTKHNYINSLSEEFSLRINQTPISGIAENLQYMEYKIYSNGFTKGLELDFRAKSGAFGELNIRLLYEISSNTPAIRKWVEVENITASSVTVDSVIVECLNLLPGIADDIAVHDLAEYLPNRNLLGLSPVILNSNLMEGLIIGNEIPGVMKYYDFYSKPNQLAVGMRRFGDAYAPAIQLEPGEVWTCPSVFIYFFAGDPHNTVENFLDFVSEYIIINKQQNYKVWFEDISDETTEDSLKNKINQAKDAKADILCLKGNWTDKLGNWTYDKKAYIKNINEYTHSSGMKFGLCIDFALAEPESFVLTQYPNLVLKPKDKLDYTIPDSNAKLMCLGSDYALFMAYEIDALVKELSLDYVQLTGTMIPPSDVGECFADNHIHRTSGESLWSIYDGLYALISYLHSQHDNLIVDISPENYYPPGGLDYAILKYADVNMGLKIED